MSINKIFLYKNCVLLATLATLLTVSSTAAALGNTNDLLDDGLDLYEHHRFDNAATALQSLVNAREFRRLDATEKTLALNHLIFSLLDQDKSAEARRFTKSLLQNSKSGFGKNSEQYADSLFIKALVEYRAKRNSDAIRTVEKMADVLERLGDEYRNDLAQARLIPGLIRQGEWNNKLLPKDLSDFFTTCEQIKPGDKIPGVTRSLNDYQLVGKDYRPTGRIKRNFQNTYLKHARESSADRANRLIYIPDENHLEHWCVIYPDGGQVDRAVTSPPKD